MPRKTGVFLAMTFKGLMTLKLSLRGVERRSNPVKTVYKNLVLKLINSFRCKDYFNIIFLKNTIFSPEVKAFHIFIKLAHKLTSFGDKPSVR